MRSMPSSAALPSPIVPVADLAEAKREARIAELQLENARLRKLVTDLLLEKMSLEEDAHRDRGRTAMKKR
jgi:hypothetical protein